MGNDSDAKEITKLLFGVRRRLWELAKAKGLTYTVVASSISQYYDLSVGSTYPELENSAHKNHKYALTMLTVDKIKFGL
jgi:hypothetical protein